MEDTPKAPTASIDASKKKRRSLWERLVYLLEFLKERIIMYDMEILGKILGSAGRVKIMRLFILNKGKAFERKDIVKRSRLSGNAVAKELRLLASVGFIKKRNNGWVFDPSFKYVKEFENVLAGPNIFNEKTITDNMKNVGRLKLLVAAGFFTDSKEGTLDILVVGDRLNKKKIEEGVRRIEAEMGKELMYSVFETKEFLYRLSMYDKLVRDVLDYPHKVILNSKELSTQSLKRP